MSQNNNQPNSRLPFSEILRMVIWGYKIYFKNGKLESTVITISNLIGELEPIIYSYIFAKTIDTLVHEGQSQNPDFSAIFPNLMLLTLSSLIFNLVGRIQGYFENKYNFYFSIRMDSLMVEKLLELGIQNLENPEVSNKIHRANNTISRMQTYINDVNRLFVELFKISTRFFIVFAISPVLLILILLTVIPIYLVDKKFRGAMWKLQLDETENRRKANSNLGYVTSPKNLEEIMVLDATKYLLNKYLNYFDWYGDIRLKILKKWDISTFGLTLVRTLSGVYGLYLIFSNFLAKKISIGDVTFQIDMVRTFQSSVSRITQILNQIIDSSMYMKDTYDLFQIKPAIIDGSIVFPKLTEGPEIELKDITFKYPNSDREIFTNLNLKINKGEKLAIVGENGAGKTTLTKLICRNYQINSGEVLINGLKLNDLRINTFYRNLGLLTQDYNTYSNLTLKENVEIGRVDESSDEVRVIEALKAADAWGFSEKYKHGLNQILSEHFKEGIRPSRGQWQKIAISRFFYRDAPLVIFDEPTSAIDAVSEYNIFNKIYSFFDKKTVIIISHRFSTVRNADRIIVLDEGKIIEEGNHEELLKIDGKYAKAFRLQAEGYTTSII